LYNPVTNFFFKYLTHLGDGLVFIPLVLYFFFVKKKFALCTAATGVVLALLVNFFKRVVFLGAPRPKKFFEGTEVLQYVDGVSIHSMHAFPSGHTATAAAVALIIALHYKDKKITWIALAIAIFIGVSRMYLALHFLQDVAFGFLLGTATASGLYFAFFSRKIWKRKRSKSPALAEHDAGLAFE
jgi:membrane-associated phospholipid phosphatase